VSLLEDTNVVASGMFPHRMTDPDWKSAPLTLSVKSGSPLFTDPGLREIAVGGGAVIVNVAGVETPISGSETVTSAEPGLARFAAGIVATRDVALAYPVANAFPFH
jgi:hypothetical protein